MSVARSCPAGACCALVNDLECAYADPISICHWRGPAQLMHAVRMSCPADACCVHVNASVNDLVCKVVADRARCRCRGVLPENIWSSVCPHELLPAKFKDARSTFYCIGQGKGHGQRNGLVLQHNAQTQLKLRSFSAALVPGLSSKSVQRAAH
eukprot:scaffold38955_cov21-Tisochrysis_lutea.AAC.2